MNFNKRNKDVPKMINQYEKKNKLKFYVNTNKKSGEKTLRFHKGKKSD